VPIGVERPAGGWALDRIDLVSSCVGRRSGHTGSWRDSGRVLPPPPANQHTSTPQPACGQSADRSRCRRCDSAEAAPAASARRNCVQVGPWRRGAGPRWWRRRIGPYRGSRHRHAELAALADNAQVSPAGILPGQAEHQVDHRGVQGPAASTEGGIAPPSADQLAVPSQQSRWGDKEDRPAIAGQQLRQRGENHPVGRRVAGPGHLPAQYQELVAEYGNLDVLCVR